MALTDRERLDGVQLAIANARRWGNVVSILTGDEDSNVADIVELGLELVDQEDAVRTFIQQYLNDLIDNT